MYFGNYEVQPMSVMRQRIAEHMIASKHVSPHVYSVDEIDMSKVAGVCAQPKKKVEKRDEKKLNLLPFLLEEVVARQRIPISIWITKDMRVGERMKFWRTFRCGRHRRRRM